MTARCTMCKAVAISAALAAISTRALAADLPVKAVAPVGYDWTGLYAGVAFGGLAGTITGPGVAGFNFHPTLWGFGVNGGYRYQLPDHIVLGLDVSAPVWSSQSTFTAPVGTLSFHPRYAVMPEAQVGYAIGRFLPFAGFGVGFTDTRVGATPTGGKTAWASGDSPLLLVTFGVDYLLTDHVIIGVRYDHVDVEQGNWNFATASPPVVTQAGGHSDGVTATLQYRF
jgi:outer membrane immunogenic protein